MYAFEYHNPTSVNDAVAGLGKAEDGKFVAGGMTLIPAMKQRLAMPSDLIDLGKITEIKGICEEDSALHVGAMTAHAEVANSADVRRLVPVLNHVAEGIGDAQVRNRGTMGGSIANNDPAADYPAALVGLKATVITNKRRIEADDFFTDMFETALEEDELITHVRFPVPEKAAYAKFPNPASRYALVGVMVAVTGGEVRVAVTGAGTCVFRATAIEDALKQSFSADALANVRISPDTLNSDLHASAEYRAHLVTVMARRAVSACG